MSRDQRYIKRMRSSQSQRLETYPDHCRLDATDAASNGIFYSYDGETEHLVCAFCNRQCIIRERLQHLLAISAHRSFGELHHYGCFLKRQNVVDDVPDGRMRYMYYGRPSPEDRDVHHRLERSQIPQVHVPTGTGLVQLK